MTAPNDHGNNQKKQMTTAMKYHGNAVMETVKLLQNKLLQQHHN